MEEGHFAEDLDVDQFAWDFYSIMLAYHHFHRLIRDPPPGVEPSSPSTRLIESSRPAEV